MRREQGFTLVELLIAVTMFIIVIASVSSVFVPLLTQFKQQSKTAETQIEGIIGLEMLRRDIKHAGFGLPWNMNLASYNEAAINDNLTDWNDSVFNDGPPNNPQRGSGTDIDTAGVSNPPGAIRSDNVGLYTSDVLVLKAANAAINGASQKWTRLAKDDVKRNGPPDDVFDPLSGVAFDNSDRVIVISQGNSAATRRSLVLPPLGDALSWKTTYNATANFASDGEEINIIYGIKPIGSPAADARMPFNRTEYYIKDPGATLPDQCAEGTGVLYKSDLNHSGGTHAGGENPVLDCVADFQVVYTINIAGVTSLATESYANTLTAAQIRDQIRTVTVYILAQEGQKDPTNCTIANPCTDNPVTVGPNSGEGRDFDFSTIPAFNNVATNNLWQNFRWKVYTISVTMENLG